MKNEIIMKQSSIIMNFSTKYCDTSESLLSSISFKKVLNKYLLKLEKNNTTIYNFLLEATSKNIEEYLIKLFKLLITLKKEEIKNLDSVLNKLLSNEEYLLEFIEDFYNYWRKYERYAIIHNKSDSLGLEHINFIDAMNNFTNLVLKTYRIIEENILSQYHRVYRQLRAGANAGLILNNFKWNLPDEYNFLETIPFIESVILHPPFIVYPKKNTRNGFFTEVKENPIEHLTLNFTNWLCFPLKVGKLLTFVYFDINFMAQGLTLCNLFELAKKEEYINKKPDCIVMFGVKDFIPTMRTEFFQDNENDMMIGYINFNEDIDYFGYMKKMILTLHNLKMIQKIYLPIHGAMVNLKLKNNLEKNIIIMGDSGAGKSETLEALKKIGNSYIKEMKVIFDDMGVLKLKNNHIVASGTEIGAFVRLDDLDIGYPYKEIDRSIFMNPDKINSRIVIPISSYSDIIKEYPIDYLLYANNFEEGEELSFFTDINEAIETFSEGKRVAKGTTNEKGVVSTFFANPFGPVQKKEIVIPIIEKYFNTIFNNNIKIGKLRTSLAIKGMEKIGPEKAGKKLLIHLMK